MRAKAKTPKAVRRDLSPKKLIYSPSQKASQTFLLKNQKTAKRSKEDDMLLEQVNYWKCRYLEDPPKPLNNTNSSFGYNSEFILREYQQRIDQLLKQITDMNNEIQQLQSKLRMYQATESTQHHQNHHKKLDGNLQSKELQQIVHLKDQEKKHLLEINNLRSHLEEEKFKSNHLQQSNSTVQEQFRKTKQEAEEIQSNLKSQITSLKHQDLLLRQQFEQGHYLLEQKQILKKKSNIFRVKLLEASNADLLSQITSLQSRFETKPKENYHSGIIPVIHQEFKSNTDLQYSSSLAQNYQFTHNSQNDYNSVLEQQKAALANREQYIVQIKCEYSFDLLLEELEVWKQKVYEIEKQKQIESRLKEQEGQDVVSSLRISYSQQIESYLYQISTLKSMLDSKLKENEAVHNQKNDLAIKLNEANFEKQKAKVELEQLRYNESVLSQSKIFNSPSKRMISNQSFSQEQIFFKLEQELKNYQQLYEHKAIECEQWKQKVMAYS